MNFLNSKAGDGATSLLSNALITCFWSHELSCTNAPPFLVCSTITSMKCCTIARMTLLRTRSTISMTQSCSNFRCPKATTTPAVVHLAWGLEFGKVQGVGLRIEVLEEDELSRFRVYDDDAGCKMRVEGGGGGLRVEG